MGIYRWYSAALLVVVLPTIANAATITTAVPRASVETLLKNASPVLNENPLGYVQAHDSQFQYQQRPYSAPVQQKITIPTPAIKEALKGALKQQAAVAVASAAVSAAVAAAGWVIDEAGKPVKKIPGSPPAGGPKDGEAYWITGNDPSTKAYTASSSCAAYDWASLGYSGYAKTEVGTDGFADCYAYYQEKPVRTTRAQLIKGTCPQGSQLTIAGCAVTQTALVTDADYDTLDSYVDQQTSDMKARLAKDACVASTSPARCFQALQDAASFLNSGPSTVQGPTSSSVTTHKNADGSISSTTTTSDTKFKMEYGTDTATATPEKTTTTKNPDGSTSETVEKEQDNSTTVQKPGEEEEGEDPLEKDYTFTNPDMPEVPSFYEQKYPDGLTSVWDDNKARFDNSAFISFMKSFVPSFSGSCPTWGLPMNIMAQASYGYVTFANICYVFDFVKIVIIATAVFTARKIMFGG